MNEKAITKKATGQVVSWDIHLEKKYGAHGTIVCSAFEVKAKAFISDEMQEEEQKSNPRKAGG